MIVKAIDLPEDKMDKDKEIDDDGDEIGNAHFEFSLKNTGMFKQTMASTHICI